MTENPNIESIVEESVNPEKDISDRAGEVVGEVIEVLADSIGELTDAMSDL
ncbi:MAG: hypothetical protein AAF518_11385 [Spirochaetota bacterium]